MTLEWRYVEHALPFLLEGTLITIAASLLAVALGLIVGIFVMLGRQSRFKALRGFVAAYISIVRGTPLFIQILIVYYALPGLGLDIPRFESGVIALSLNSGAYISEMIRGGLMAIPKGQLDAAKAFGMRSSLIWRRITLPQVLVLILPPLTIEFTGLLKASALLSVIGLVELTRRAQEVIGETLRSPEVWLTTAALYFVMCFALGTVTRRLEKAAAAYRL
ncbi:MAG TPA: amino acid ABC transporter permease [Reyranella sp.]|nr:amino acid ABC transporter permease [Reyranella sp.]